MLEFVPNEKSSYQFAKLNPEYFNKFGCDGDFKTIVNKEADQLAKRLCDILATLNVDDSTAPETTDSGSTEESAKNQQKRTLTPVYSTTSKKQKTDSSQHVKDIEQRCNECQFDNNTYFIPVEKLVIPPKNRQIRAVDETFLAQLVKSMKNQPAGNYEALFVAVKGINKKESFNKERIHEFEYEVLGGTHVTLATKQLHEEFPENRCYSGRTARIYVGLKDEEALWLGAMHNNTGAFRHNLTYKDEVAICRTQLLEFGNPQPSESWRDMCSSLLNRSKRNLSEVFSMAQIPDEGWSHFLDINDKWEKGELKDQKIKAGEIVKKGKPVMKQWQLKPLCSLAMSDRTFLLEKVAKREMSLEEMKAAAKDIKVIRPVQEAVTAFFKMDSWEEAVKAFGEEVAANKLLRFAGKQFEQCHEFQMFLAKLKRKKDGVEVPESSGDLITGANGSTGFVMFVDNLLDVTQRGMTKIPNFVGAFLAIGDVKKDYKMADDILKVVSKVNFTMLTSFNVVLLTSIDDVKEVKSKMVEGGAFCTQIVHFYLKDKMVNEKKNPVLKPSLETFVIGHWSVSKVLTERHLSGSNDNVITAERSKTTIPESVYLWLVSSLSIEGDTVLDINSESGEVLVCSLNGGRNAVWLSTAPQDCHDMMINCISTSIDITQEDIVEDEDNEVEES